MTAQKFNEKYKQYIKDQSFWGLITFVIIVANTIALVTMLTYLIVKN